MGGTLVRMALRRALRQVRHVSPVRPRAATAQVRRVYTQVERDFGMMAPPTALHSPAPGPLAASWVLLREALLVPGFVDRATKEAVAAAVSVGNACPYCVAVHGATVYGLLRDTTAEQIAADRVGSITDPTLRAIVGWARAGGTEDTARGHDVPFPIEQAPELIGTAATFQYLNRMVNVFLGDSPLPPSVPESARPTVMKVLGGFMRAAAGNTLVPGASLDLLPPAAPPTDAAWAAGNPTVADAFARAAAAFDQAGVHSASVAVRALLTAHVADWDGTPMGVSRAWADDAAAGLSEEDFPAGRLALLTALASYQVDESVVADFRRYWPEDRKLVELTSWASFTAARRVAGWMWDTIPPGRFAPTQDVSSAQDPPGHDTR